MPARPVDEHLQRILDAVAPLPPYDQSLLEALGLPVCEDIRSPVDLPRSDASATDGYAVRAVDVAGAGTDGPVRLPVVGEVSAGQSRAYALSPGTALKVTTGAPVPRGADAVVPLPSTDGGVAHVVVHRAPRPGDNVRLRGEDVEVGDVLVEQGAALGPRTVGLLAAVGRAQVRARPRPRVVVMSTGSELREPGGPLASDSVVDANSHLLAAAARAAGAIPYRVGVVPDDPQEFVDALSDQLVRADAVVTSGGVSHGDDNVVKQTLGKLGTVEFDDVAMDPGMPQGFGTVGDDRTPIFALPGDPVSAYVSFEVFVVPALRRMMGRVPYRLPLVRATCLDAIDSPAGTRHFVRGDFTVEVGGAQVGVVGGAGSHLIGELARANSLVVVPEDTTRVEPGETVSVLAVDREF